MSAYDEIRSILRAALEEARLCDAREVAHKGRTSAALARAIDRYDRFTLHGMIPEDFAENRENLVRTYE